MADAAEGGELLLQGLHVGPVVEAGAGQDAIDGGQHLCPVALVGCLQV
jgi:hypothetical protein